MVSFTGLVVGTASLLAAPFLPSSIPLGDLGVILAVIAWVLLLKHYHGIGWKESLFTALIAAVLYVTILAFASGFTILLDRCMQG